MKTFFLVIFCAFVLAGCQTKQEIKNKLLDKTQDKVEQLEGKVIEVGDEINQKIDEERQEDTTAPDPTDQALFDQLNSDDASQADFKDLENELN